MEREDFSFNDFHKRDRAFWPYASRKLSEFPYRERFTSIGTELPDEEPIAFEWMKKLGLFEPEKEISSGHSGTRLGSTEESLDGREEVHLGMDLVKVKRVKSGGAVLHEFVFVSAWFSSEESLPQTLWRSEIRFHWVCSPYEHRGVLLTKNFKETLVAHLGHKLSTPRDLSDERYGST